MQWFNWVASYSLTPIFRGYYVISCAVFNSTNIPQIIWELYCDVPSLHLFRVLSKKGNLRKLTHLDLSGCLNLSARALQELVVHCPSLHHESFFYCDNISEGPFPDTASGCQNLECTRRVCCRSGR